LQKVVFVTLSVSEGSRFFGRKLPQNDRNLEAFAKGSKVKKLYPWPECLIWRVFARNRAQCNDNLQLFMLHPQAARASFSTKGRGSTIWRTNQVS
jgi:hypothetical protein